MLAHLGAYIIQSSEYQNRNRLFYAGDLMVYIDVTSLNTGKEKNK